MFTSHKKKQIITHQRMIHHCLTLKQGTRFTDLPSHPHFSQVHCHTTISNYTSPNSSVYNSCTAANGTFYKTYGPTLPSDCTSSFSQQYNKYMGGVDKADQLVQYYRLRAFGTDGEEELVKAFSLGFRVQLILSCFIHINHNIKHA